MRPEASSSSWPKGAGPIRVLVIDLERPPVEVSGLHPDGGRYAAAWLLLRRDGRPINLLKVAFAGEREALSREELAAQIESAVADAPTPARSAASQARLRQPMISVVVPSRLERRETLSRCIESLEALDYPSYELLLVDNRVSDEGGSVAWLERFPSVRVVRERRPGVSVARNRGLEAAAGEIVAYIDDDVSVDPGWLTAIAARFAARPEEACVTGLILPAELETPAEVRLERYYDGDGVAPRIFQPVSHRLAQRARGRGIIPGTSVGQFDDEDRLLRTFSIYAAGRFGTGANMAFRSSVLRDIGGLDVRLGTGMPATGGDLHVFIRLLWKGHSIGFEPAALVHHAHHRDERSLQKQIEANGVGATALICALIEEDPRHILAMLATLPQAARSPYLRTIGTRFRKATNSARDTPAGPDAEDQIAMSRLTRTELRGMARGPAAYWRSRRLVREW